MTSSYYPHISDELLSAYIDDVVTDEERQLVETAVLTDTDVAWRLQMLQHTVSLLHSLPQFALPRNFTLSGDQLVDGQSVRQMTPVSWVASTSVHRNPLVNQHSGLFATLRLHWLRFWEDGNSFLRNAATASLALFMLLLIGDIYSSQTLDFSHTETTAQLVERLTEPSTMAAQPAAAMLDAETTASTSPQSETVSESAALAQSIEPAGEQRVAFALPTVTPTPEAVASLAASAGAAKVASPFAIDPQPPEPDAIAPGELVETRTSFAKVADGVADLANEPVPVTRPQLSQFAAGLLTFILIVLWWYSRSLPGQPRRQSPLHR